MSLISSDLCTGGDVPAASDPAVAHGRDAQPRRHRPQVAPVLHPVKIENLFELMTSNRKLKASREGSK